MVWSGNTLGVGLSCKEHRCESEWSVCPHSTQTYNQHCMAEYIPPRAQLYVWMENLEKLKTGDFLAEKGIIDFQQAICPFCNLEVESNSHILFTCRFSWSAWMKMLEWWSISRALHNRCRNFSEKWFGPIQSRKRRKLWGLVLGCVIRSLWYERNKIKFKTGSPNHHNVVYSLKPG